MRSETDSGFWGEAPFLKDVSFLATLILILSTVVLLPRLPVRPNIESANPSSRLSTLHQIVTQSNQRRFFQIAPGVPMEATWEDPAMGAALSAVAFIRQNLPYPFNRVELDELYQIQLALIFLVFLLPFSSLFKHLPGWFFPVIPASFFVSVAQRFIFFDWDQYWVGSLGTVWAFAGVFNLLGYFRKESTSKWSAWNIGISVFVLGLGVGLLGLFRRNVIFEGVAAVFFVFLILAVKTWFRPAHHHGWKRWIPLGLVVVFFGGVLMPRSAVNRLWGWRDAHYEMQNVPRNPRHPFWLPVYLGLGHVQNQFGIKWDDGVGYAHLRKEFPNVPYATAEYDAAFKQMFFKAIRQDPALLPRNLLAKAGALADELGAVFWPMMLLLYYGLIWKPLRLAALAGGGCLMAWSATPLLCNPYKLLSLGFLSGAHLVMLAMSAGFLYAAYCFPGPLASLFSPPLPWRQLRKIAFPILLAAALLIVLYPFFYFFNRTQNPVPPQAVNGTVLRWEMSETGTVDSKPAHFQISADNKEQLIEVPLANSTAPIVGIRVSPVISSTIDVHLLSIVLEKKSKPLREFLFTENWTAEEGWMLKSFKMVSTPGGAPILRPTGSFIYVQKTFPAVAGADKIAVRLRLIPRRTFAGWLKGKYL